MRDITIFLITQIKERGEDGQTRTTEEAREVFARLTSAGRNEFFKGQQVGFAPEYVFEVAAVDYEGETLCAFDGIRYKVYRSYENGDMVELNVERIAGTN